MGENTNIQIILLLFICLPLANVTGQTLHFPISGNSTDDFSSPFGPRNLGSANYPNTGYDYDFHGGVDIGNAPQGTNIYALFDGVVLDKGSSWVTVSKSTEDGVYFKFHHLQNISVNINDQVTGGVTKLGETDNQIHLDLRYLNKQPPNLDYVDNADWGLYDYNAQNPASVLVTNNASSPVILDAYGDPLNHLILDEDDGTSHYNQQGMYFEIGARVVDDELDVSTVLVMMTWEDETGNVYDAADLLMPSTCTDYPNLPNYVDYDFRINCGDITGNNSDVGHNCEPVGIYPKRFSRTDDYHTVYFRWYINESFWNQKQIFSSLNDLYVDITVLDLAFNITTANNIDIVTCIGCSPPDEAPLPPSLLSVNYQPTGKVNLTWQASASGESAEFYRIYRCLAGDNMSDNDLIGITTLTEYLDDDNDLVSNESYKYAVAGVNWAGEGYNSNELSITLPCYNKEISNKVYMGYAVENGCNLSIHDVEIKSGANVLFKTDESVTITGNFIVETGSLLEVN
ncbi:MAG: peptidoglycan DD-metalloendopeptidase family protein [Mariniphaga sp.]|nr:peptidoglycan DD-metalloendopeptidase family protein [Mariniphaga sp.]